MCSCDRCIQEDKENICIKCKNNPIYDDLKDYFISYYPVCPAGYGDCIYDPAYIKLYDPEWYEELYGDLTVEEAMEQEIKEGHCLHSYGYCRNYDDEDK